MAKVSKGAILVSCFFLLFFTPSLYSLGGSDDLVASLAQLPGLADSPDKGTFVDLVNAIGSVYTKGRITIGVYPFSRSMNNVITGQADFHIPSIRNPNIDQSKLPYGMVKVPMGKVTFVIYSSSTHVLTRKMLNEAIAAGGKFPYKIDIAGGIENQYPFPGDSTNDIEPSLRKVAAGRIDALVWAQEEADATLKAIKLKNIHREFWMDFDDVVVIPKGQEGERLDSLLSAALTTLNKNGRLNTIHSKVHHSYDNWQPDDMGW
jgi:hypothetical protein